MHIPSNVPSSSNRTASRESTGSRLQPSGILLPSTRRTKQETVLLVRPILQSFVCLAVEPEDAKLTGATRSLSRRLLALNIRHDN